MDFSVPGTLRSRFTIQDILPGRDASSLVRAPLCHTTRMTGAPASIRTSKVAWTASRLFLSSGYQCLPSLPPFLLSFPLPSPSNFRIPETPSHSPGSHCFWNLTWKTLVVTVTYQFEDETQQLLAMAHGTLMTPLSPALSFLHSQYSHLDFSATPQWRLDP